MMPIQILQLGVGGENLQGCEIFENVVCFSNSRNVCVVVASKHFPLGLTTRIINGFLFGQGVQMKVSKQQTITEQRKSFYDLIKVEESTEDNKKDRK